MPIDGCEHSYHELGHEVLPKYLNALRGRMIDRIPLAGHHARLPDCSNQAPSWKGGVKRNAGH